MRQEPLRYSRHTSASMTDAKPNHAAKTPLRPQPRRIPSTLVGYYAVRWNRY